MERGRVSIIIPSRNERHLQRTIDSLLTNAAGDVEVIAILDGGPWPDPPLRADKRLIVVRHNDPMGMRPSINEGAQIASGEFLLKCDAHCIFAPGYDAVLKEDCDPQTLVVPIRHSLDPIVWERDGEQAALNKRKSWQYTSLTFPYAVTEYGAGIHAVTLPWDKNKRLNDERQHLLVDDLLSFQGSCWFQCRDTFLKDGPLDHGAFYFYGEAQESGLLRYWLRGRRCVVSKKTFYGHLHKGREHRGADGRQGRGFYLSLQRKRECEALITDICVNNKWPGQTRTFESVIEQFWWIISRMEGRFAWPSDWRDWEKHRQVFEGRAADQIPAHIG